MNTKLNSKTGFEAFAINCEMGTGLDDPDADLAAIESAALSVVNAL